MAKTNRNKNKNKNNTGGEMNILSSLDLNKEVEEKEKEKDDNSLLRDFDINIKPNTSEKTETDSETETEAETEDESESETETDSEPDIKEKDLSRNKPVHNTPHDLNDENKKESVDENENYCLNVSTSQVSSIKTLMEALKDLLIETSISFDETGLKIFTIDNKHIVIIHMKLHAHEFERYYCRKPISIGVNMVNLYKIIKTINNGDTLTFFMDANERFGMDALGIKIENGAKNTKATSYLNLYDLDPEIIEIDPIEYNSIIHLPSSDFSKIIRDMSGFAQDVEICNVGNQLKFRCKGEVGAHEMVFTDNPVVDQSTGEVRRSIIIYNKNIEKITQGVFNLKFLSMFIKCTNLSNTVELNIGNDYPLVVQYNIATLGQIRLCIAPTISDMA